MFSKDQVEWLLLQLGAILVWSQRRMLLTFELFNQFSLGSCPRDLLQGKSGRENEEIKTHL